MDGKEIELTVRNTLNGLYSIFEYEQRTQSNPISTLSSYKQSHLFGLNTFQIVFHYYWIGHWPQKFYLFIYLLMHTLSSNQSTFSHRSDLCTLSA